MNEHTKECVILLANFKYGNRSAALDKIGDFEHLIAADRGQFIARDLGLFPDVVIGDLDSSDDARIFECEYVVFPRKKDLSDSEAALDFAVSSGYKDIWMFTDSGGRMDHSIANAMLLTKYKDINVTLVTACSEIRYIENTSFTIHYDENISFFGIIPVDESASGIDITGAKYSLSNATILRASTLGISNEPLPGEDVTISVKQGGLFVIKNF
jgi:thiamine pyrophosphokinase